MDDYVAEVRKLENKFAGLEIHHVIRDNNVGADLLSKLGSTRAQVPAGIFVQELHHPSIKTTEPPTTDFAPADASREVMMLDVDWRVDIINYILNEKLPTDKTEAIRITRRSKGYVLVGSKLYKRGSHSGVLMKYIPCEGEKLCWMKSTQIWLLLAHGSGRRRKSRPSVYKVPILWQTDEGTSTQPDNYTMLGARHDRPSHHSARKSHPRVGSHRQVHKVDRVQTSHHLKCRQGCRFHMRHPV